MNRETAYVSSIPTEAVEKVVERYAASIRKAEYYLNGEKVGLRLFYPTGELDLEYPLRNGLLHGVVYRWDTPGKLLSATPYENGVEHGTAYQWADGGPLDGHLIGTYTMERGTGVDLWWDWSDSVVTLSKAYFMKDGLRHGFEWWLWKAEEPSLWWERHWQRGKLHGIERQWNLQGGLRRGYPRYWLEDQQVVKRQYLKAAAKDPTLPSFRSEDNRPYRAFPPEIAKHLRPLP